jgi:hypothetical protein
LDESINIRRYSLRGWQGTGKNDSFSRDFNVPHLPNVPPIANQHGWYSLAGFIATPPQHAQHQRALPSQIAQKSGAIREPWR